MKKLFAVMIVTLMCALTTMVEAQIPTEVSRPFFPNNYPSLTEIKARLSDYSERSHKVFLALVETANYELADTTFRFNDAEQLSLDSIFAHILPTPEVVTLNEKEWLNLFFSESKSKVDWKFGGQYTGPVWMMQIGSYKFPFMLVMCGNGIYRVTQYTPKGFSTPDMYSFKRRLNSIGSQLNFISQKVDNNKTDSDAKIAEIKAMLKSSDNSRAEENARLKNMLKRDSLKFEMSNYRTKGWLDMLATGVAGGFSYYLWDKAMTKVATEVIVPTPYNVEYEIPVYTLHEEDVNIPVSSGKALKTGGTPTIANPYTPGARPEIHFNLGPIACGGDDHNNGHDNDHNGCNDNDHNTTVIQNIYNLITNNNIDYNTFVTLVTENYQVFQDFITNYNNYVTNNYNTTNVTNNYNEYKYVTEVTQILNTYNTYVTNNYTYITNNYYVKKYTLSVEMVKKMMTLNTYDRGLGWKDNVDKGLYVAGAVALDVAAGYFLERAIHNFSKAHGIKLSLMTNTRSIMTATSSSQMGVLKNTQLKLTMNFGASHKYACR